MRKILFLLCVMACITASAQTTDEGRIAIKALMPDGQELTTEASGQIETKMQQLLTNNGYADNDYAERFVLTAKVDVISKDVAPSTPARISEKMDVTFFVGDVVENKVYASATLQVTGIGVNENKAYISAFNNIKTDNPKLRGMLSEAKAKIIDYYTNNCAGQIARTKTLAATGQYDEAIANMMSVPNVCSDCFSKCQQATIDFYQQKIDTSGRQLLEKARNMWTKNPHAEGTAEVIPILNEISVASTVFTEVEQFREQIVARLSADEQKALEQEQRDWDFKMRQYNDAQENKSAVIKACHDIGVAWAKNQPKTITRTIIHGWW